MKVGHAHLNTLNEEQVLNIMVLPIPFQIRVDGATDHPDRHNGLDDFFVDIDVVSVVSLLDGVIVLRPNDEAGSEAEE